MIAKDVDPNDRDKVFVVTNRINCFSFRKICVDYSYPTLLNKVISMSDKYVSGLFYTS